MKAPAEFTVVRFVPDPIAGECINVGVIVIHDGRVRYSFLQNMKRVRQFAQQAGLDVVYAFRQHLIELTQRGPLESQAQLPIPLQTTESAAGFVRQAATSWNHQIQCTPLQASMDHPDRLLERLVQRYLKQPSAPASRTIVTRTQVASRAVSELKRALPVEVGSKFTIATNQHAPGLIIPKIVMDVSIMNGELRAAGQATSFQVSDSNETRRVWQDALLSLDDLRRSNPDVLVSFHYEPPRLNQPALQRELDDARFAAEKARIPLVGPGELPTWARETVEDSLENHYASA